MPGAVSMDAPIRVFNISKEGEGMLSETLIHIMNDIQAGLDVDSINLRPVYVASDDLLMGCWSYCEGSCEDSCTGSCDGRCIGGCSDGCVAEGEGFCDFTR